MLGLYILALAGFRLTLSSAPGLIDSAVIDRRNSSGMCPAGSQLTLARNSMTKMVFEFLEHEGWIEVVNLDMTDPNHSCPFPWTEESSPSRLCEAPACNESVIFTIPKKPYSQVRGRVTGYGYGTLDAFAADGHSIEGNYLDGVSITHGSSPRQHIWSLASGYSYSGLYVRCPCEYPIQGITNPQPPAFVGDNYFCGDPANGLLWDGEDCSSICCTFNNPPWFNVTLSSPTSDDLEVRMCTDESIHNERILIQKIQIFVR